MVKHMVSLLLLSAALVGCQVGSGLESGGSKLDEADIGSRPLARPLGTYRASNEFDPSVSVWTAGDLLTVTFMVDRAEDGRIRRRFHGELLVYCAQGGPDPSASIIGPCPPMGIEGTYEFKYGGRDRQGREYDYIYLYTDHGELHFAYTQTVDEDTGALSLHLRQVRTTGWATYDYAPMDAWCAAAADCAAQELPHPRCPGAWSCDANACVYGECGPWGPTPTPCPMTGVLCTEDCIDGQTPGGGPCHAGTLDEQTCECVAAE